MVPSFSDIALAQVPPCNVQICKVAPQLPPAFTGDDLVLFDFTEIRGDSVTDFTLAANDNCTGGSYDLGESAVILEVPRDGWILADVDCTTTDGISTAILPDGVQVHCLSEGFISCTFTNVQQISNIPALSEWGMIATAAGLALIGVFFAVRRKRLQDAL
ncbi:MAG TPA: hypothetical protein VFJ67_07510 [Thermodesulfobacteriota bacterium]|nr:hypothetical protein [Thermodesulfobacteriota bacterium]